eukprot:UN10086
MLYQTSINMFWKHTTSPIILLALHRYRASMIYTNS